MTAKKELITSVQNTQIKNLVKLHESKHRREQHLFIIEGFRLIEAALNPETNSLFELDTLYYCDELLGSTGQKLLKSLSKKNIETQAVNTAVFNKITTQQNPQGMLLTAKTKSTELESLAPENNALYLVLEGLEKPGNLGAILRTADAVGVDAVICTDGITDIFNPQCIQNSMGSVFNVPVVLSSSLAVFEWLQKNDIASIASTPRAKKTYTDIKIPKCMALIMGSEDLGLTPFWLENATEKVSIPMRPHMDSLNLATATAILLYGLKGHQIA
jgi:TrmH family RNA methyltransferase